MKTPDIIQMCIAAALGAGIVVAVIDTTSWVACTNQAGGLACRVFKDDLGKSWSAVSALALGIAYRKQP